MSDNKKSFGSPDSEISDPIIELVGVRRHFRTGATTVKAIDEINMQVRRGDFLTITGASGSGKSTLLNLIGLLDTPTEGSVRIKNIVGEGLQPRERSAIRMKEIGFIFQFFNLQKNLTALENVMIPHWFAGHTRETSIDRAADLLAEVGLSDRLHHLPSELSGGQQQRVAIARALVNRPSIILADEPTGNLDSVVTREIIQLFNKLNAEDQTILLVTHEPDITNCGNRTIELLDGRIVRDQMTEKQCFSKSG
jgi:ABC-type lipoprotein export system ATPase subunit